jgi:NadR type nicotinamide-nucleotide adenylyltransferase
LERDINTNIKKVVIIGPECTGKSDLSHYLASYYNTIWVPEYAREFIDNLTRPYEQHDLLTISHHQTKMEDKAETEANQIIICDTNAYVIKVWSNFKFGYCHPEILSTIQTRKYDLYLLTYIDIPWEEDPQREHPEKRQQLYDIYLQEMLQQPVPFREIKGDRDQRRNLAKEAIDIILTDRDLSIHA